MKRLRWIVVMLVAFALVAAACSSSDSDSTDTTAADGGDTATTAAGGDDGADMVVGADFTLFGAPTGVEGQALEGYLDVYNDQTASNIVYIVKVRNDGPSDAAVLRPLLDSMEGVIVANLPRGTGLEPDPDKPPPLKITIALTTLGNQGVGYRINLLGFPARSAGNEPRTSVRAVCETPRRVVRAN